METPDTKPGNYYVSMIRGSRYALLAGPFHNDHAAALALVDQCRTIAADVDPRSHFDAFGTVRFDLDLPAKPGVLNSQLGIQPETSPCN